jgi:hypothetical protein
LLLLLAVSPVTWTSFAGDLADEPNAFQKRVDYPKTLNKLLDDFKNLPDYVDAMKKVHARFHGTPGTLAMFGASMTGAREFWAPLKDGGKNMSPRMQKDYDLVKACMKPECWNWKGGRHGNTGGMLSKWVMENADKWMKELNPEVVVILIGCSDMDLRPPEQSFKDWEQNVTEASKTCLANGTVVILCTFPPRNSRRCDVYNERVMKIATALNLPVCDFGGECLKRRPNDWDGTLPQFKGFEKYEVPTLICGDGEHPSCPKAFANDYSEEALKTSGYNLRTHLTLTVYADVLRKVCGVK